ncbi:serine hydrolase domain-containing protein [Actinokineospora globicatena]|uniref:serine hydrolase domain-containing protein n=1 Tax=Actinokineospora globicatena TaxID=103729 RepID=UPI0020A60490|nr:serine hydrolase domain-containing protein [Actinokineospora globicatena]MCP2300755.1 CubicO group peptidase, beta-lactamase class C family [Actinokineospora globicatena]GLW77620.1 serine hydrolase [Actinokineospora globicatena]GLW84456.1 serine hydrolase [Actinokineospora globicatena]
MLHTTENALLRRIAVEQAESRAPSLVAAVVRGHELVWTGARGKVDGSTPTTETQYRIGSITKSFVAALVMRLRDEGRLDLNDPLDKHVPGTAIGAVTIAQLLAHTSGLTSESPGTWWERAEGADFAALDKSLATDALRHRPGAKFHYSNVGYGVLGELVARLRGASWLEVLEAEILKPLELNRTTPHPIAPAATGWAVHPYADVLLHEPTPDAVAMAPAGQLWCSVLDLARWNRFVGGDTGDVLSPDTVAEMREPAHIDDDATWASGYGLGLQVLKVGGRRLVGHGGSMPGFLAMNLVDPKTGTGGVIMANSTGGVNIGGVAADLIELTEQHEPVLPAEWEPLVEADPALLALTGQWHWGPTPYVLKLLPDGWLSLVPVSGRGRQSRFRPEGGDTFTGLDGYYSGETLRVHRDGSGAATHLDLATFVFTREPYGVSESIPGGVDEQGWRTREG